MKLRFVVDLIRAQGQRETITTEFDKTSVLLGRGGGADIRYESLLFSLEHLRFLLEGEKLIVEDLDSLSGVRVNSRTVRRQELKDGDILSVGDTTLSVSVLSVRRDGDCWEIFEERHEGDKEDAEERTLRFLENIQIAGAFPRMTLLSAIGVLIVLVVFFFIPLTNAVNHWSKLSWKSGPMSTPHKMIEADCESCHAVPFQQVQDSACLACHELSDHAEAFNEEPMASNHSEPRCAECHMEHNGDSGITLTDSALCTECHSNLDGVYPDTEMKNVEDFSHHPEFSVSLLPVVDSTLVETKEVKRHRVSLSHKDELIDGARMKLNHKVHLEEGLKGPEGPETLSCNDCHTMTPKTKTFEPIFYVEDCARCHMLEFDDRLPGNEVPHGDADVVYNYAYAEYAKLFLDGEGHGAPIPGFERFKPGGARKSRTEKESFSRNEVDSAAREAEEILFTKTACHLCHEIRERAPEEFANERMTKGRYEVYKPRLPKVWMPEARFDHSAHMEVKCESCHEGVLESRETTDVLMPKVKTCQSCHGDGGDHCELSQFGLIPSDCIMCHSYHDQLVFPDKKKRKIEEIASMVMHQ